MGREEVIARGLPLLDAISVQFSLLYFVITSWIVDFGLLRISEMFLMLCLPFDKPTISSRLKGRSSGILEKKITNLVRN
ncbi:10372_t:CDS:2 [Funneliformis mosseae]|uniref:10372_t:CDS:1 n=1 Tax=Funneliformis mosseae TaxID=27381 RepID=A0A9N8V5V8_FUNMO|nr:10372_t:CDS:2 [Funneliformis mosseae]